MKIIGDFIRVTQDGSWSKWKCRRCGNVRYFINYEEPNGQCEFCKERRETEIISLLPDGTLKAFNCCTSLPPKCEECPLFTGQRFELAKEYERMGKCKGRLKGNVRYWLEQLERIRNG